jgi:DNA-binding transcriptional ArsR family regulator
LIAAMDDVFKALADPVRRALLDRLLREGGLSLARLCEGQDMTRFGVMKHVRVLERAQLVVTRRAGRETLHYLNVVPIRMIHDRWIGKYAGAISSAMLGLKARLEQQPSPQRAGARRRKASS